MTQFPVSTSSSTPVLRLAFFQSVVASAIPTTVRNHFTVPMVNQSPHSEQNCCHFFIGKKQCSWNFIVAAVSRRLIVANFLIKHGILVDLKGKRLLDNCTDVTSPFSSPRTSVMNVEMTATAKDTHKAFLDNFTSISTPTFTQSSPKHGVKHFIVTSGPPVHARARRLPPDY